MNVINATLSLLAIATSLACMYFLFRGYAERRMRLLLWSALCFVGLSINNILLFADLVLFPATDLRPVRLISALAGMMFLLYGFIWDSE